MQKKIIALAIAGIVSGSAFAQSNVTVYGIVDTGMEVRTQSSDTTQTNNMTRTNITNSGLYTTRIGFKGSEDLGGGMKANFFIESNLGTDAPAATTLGDRLMTLGLSGGFGSVNLGRQYTPYFNVLAAGDTFAYAGRGSALNIIGANHGTVRQSNSVRWDSPDWSGFKAAVMWGAGTETATTTNKPDSENFGLNLTYGNGPLALGYAYERMNANAVQSATVGDWDRNAVSGSYNFGAATLVGGYLTNKQGGSSQITNNAVTYLGVRIPVSAAGLVRVQWGQMNDKLVTNADQQFWSLGYAHSMSKRTTAYVNYGNFDNKINAAGVADWRALQAGIAHTF